MSDTPMKFIRKNGKVIPLRAAAGAASSAAKRVALKATKVGSVAGAAVATARAIGNRSNNPKQNIKVNPYLNALGLGTAVVSGLVGAATFSKGAKGFLGGAAAAIGIDSLGIAANIASVSGQGHLGARIKQGARQEARNAIVGNAVYAAGILSSAANRAQLASSATQVVSYGTSLLTLVGRKLAGV